MWLIQKCNSHGEWVPPATYRLSQTLVQFKSVRESQKPQALSAGWHCKMDDGFQSPIAIVAMQMLNSLHTPSDMPFGLFGQRGSALPIFVTFQNRQSNIYARFLKWLARCAQMWKWGELQVLSKLFSPHIPISSSASSVHCWTVVLSSELAAVEAVSQINQCLNSCWGADMSQRTDYTPMLRFWITVATQEMLLPGRAIFPFVQPACWQLVLYTWAERTCVVRPKNTKQNGPVSKGTHAKNLTDHHLILKMVLPSPAGWIIRSNPRDW